MKKLIKTIKQNFNDYLKNGMSKKTKQRLDYFFIDMTIANIIIITTMILI